MQNTKDIKITECNSMKNNDENYYWGLDLIRILAMFFVILVHSTSFYGYIGCDISSFPIFLAGVGRYLSYTCIPLFLILTGYLNSNKTPTLRYYFKILKILIEFVLCGIVVFLVNRFCFDNTTSILTFARKLFAFQYPSYSWYINMFVGLFLLTPFLNSLYKSLSNNTKLILIISLVLIFSLPNVTSYWTIAYPIMYYFIGLFLKDKQFKIKNYILLLCIILICVLQTLISQTNLKIYTPENHYNLGCLILSISIFLLFYNLKTPQSSTRKIKIIKPLRIIANASLSTFLISQIFETLTSTFFSKLAITTFSEKLPYLAYLTPIKFILSVICGLVISFLASQLYKLTIRLTDKIIEKRKNKAKKNSN